MQSSAYSSPSTQLLSIRQLCVGNNLAWKPKSVVYRENKLLASHELQVNILELIQAFLVMRITLILNFVYFT